MPYDCTLTISQHGTGSYTGAWDKICHKSRFTPYSIAAQHGLKIRGRNTGAGNGPGCHVDKI